MLAVLTKILTTICLSGKEFIYRYNVYKAASNHDVQDLSVFAVLHCGYCR